MTLVIDASVAIGWSLPDERSDIALSVLEVVRVSGATTPSLFKFEVANVLNVAMRRGRIEGSTRDQILWDLNLLALNFDTESEKVAWTRLPGLAEKHGLSAYDAAYLEVAKRMDATIATLDEKLAIEAEAAGVDLFKAPS